MSVTMTTKNAQNLLARMLRVAKSYKDYNVREYLVRRTNDTYELNKEKPEEFEKFAEKELKWMERQEKVYEMYGSERKSVLDDDDVATRK
ncbi:unnamed protein product [Bathycoccus prasinos]